MKRSGHYSRLLSPNVAAKDRHEQNLYGKAEKNKDNSSRPRSEAPAEESDLIWGINAVHEAVKHQPESVVEVSLQKGKSSPRIQAIVELARDSNVKLRFVDPAGFRLPKSVPHQGVLAKIAAVPLYTLEELVADVLGDGQLSGKKLLVLDSIQDPRNLGSILRSALAAGFRHVVVTRERSAPLGGTVARTSAGAVSHLRICQVTNLAAALEVIKEAGFWVYGAVVAGDSVTSIYEADFSGAVCVVIGSEGKGIRPLVQKKCDHLVTIPMASSFNSLNAAVAAGVFMFEVGRQQSGMQKG